LQQARDGFEVLEPLQFVLLDFVPFWMHARYFRQGNRRAQVENRGIFKKILPAGRIRICGANRVPNRIEAVPGFPPFIR
ncbi:MAG TPA: hypothetical protein VI699_10250, partial [Candidatus Acidoferrales bacterium]|nr:hypothetical protein [Candidatus Acidoferrales bacterium]